MTTSTAIPLPGQVLALLGGLSLLGVSLWILPGSPVTLWRADAAVGAGELDDAVQHYDDVARTGWTFELRRRALRRSAVLYATELARPAEARVRLERALRLESDPVVQAELHEQIGHLWAANREPAIALRSFLAAHAAHPSHRRAPERLVLAGRAALDADKESTSAEIWALLAESYPSHLSVARLAQARIALVHNDAHRAHGRFSEAFEAARTPDQRAAARLGIATSLERLGNLDEAIAELDQLDLPGGVRDRRLDSLKVRRDVRGR